MRDERSAVVRSVLAALGYVLRSFDSTAAAPFSAVVMRPARTVSGANPPAGRGPRRVWLAQGIPLQVFT